MRFVYMLILLILAGAVAIFAVQNDQGITLRYLDRSLPWPIPMSLLIVAVYFLGMISGGTVVGFFQRTWRRVRETESLGEARRSGSGVRFLLVIVCGIVGGVLGYAVAIYWGQPFNLEPSLTTPFGFVAGLLLGWSVV